MCRGIGPELNQFLASFLQGWTFGRNLIGQSIGTGKTAFVQIARIYRPLVLVGLTGALVKHPFVARMLTEDGNCYHRSLNSGSILISTWNTRGTIPRQFLGRGTSVNKAVAESIKTPTEHKYFPAFHNGVTILCKSLTASDKTIEISGYAVVNGCQSITSLYENAASITPDLRMITKFHRSGAGFPARY